MQTKRQWVSDEVWEALDPKAGAIRRIDTKRLAAGVAIVAVAVALWLSGVIHSRLDWSSRGGYRAAANPNTRVITTDVAIEHEGWIDVRIVGVGQDGPGLKLIGTTSVPHIGTDNGRTPPFTLHPGQAATMSLTYQVTDCAAVPSGAFDVAVRVERAWGTQTVSVAIPRGFALGARAAEEEWQRALADAACGAGS